MWVLLLSPFITIIMSFLLMKGLLPDSDNPQEQKVYTLVASNLFALFVLLGFSLCSGMFILAPVSDKENKLRHLMNFVGMKPLAYYLGSFFADIILFTIPTVGFIILLFPLGIRYFIINWAWATMLAIMVSFGISLISLTYLFSFMFSSANTAFKNIGIIYLIGGTFLPGFIGGIFTAATGSIEFYKVFRYIFTIDPFWNFSDAMNYNMIRNFARDTMTDTNYNDFMN